MTGAIERLWYLLALVGREAEQLLGVSSRLFVGKFSRMQDTMMDKLLPTFLVAIGERSATALDNLNLAHKLQFVTDPDAWLAMRLLRNKLVHEYVEEVAELAAVIPLRCLTWRAAHNCVRFPGAPTALPNCRIKLVAQVMN